MQVQTINNQPGSKGVKLSFSNYAKVTRIAGSLECAGFDYLGYRGIYCDNNMNSKISKIHSIRYRCHNTLVDRAFGIVFFLRAKETYIIAAPDCEQSILPITKHYDKGAAINLSI